MHLILFFSQYNSYYGHKFAVRFTDHKEGVELTHIVNADDQTITIDSDAKRSYLRIKHEKVFGSFEDKLAYSTDTCQVQVSAIFMYMYSCYDATFSFISFEPILYIHSVYHYLYSHRFIHSIILYTYYTVHTIIYYTHHHTLYTLYYIIRIIIHYQDIPKGDEYVSCITKQLNTDFFRVTESKDKVKEYLDNVSNHLRNYTCSDINMNSSPSVSTYSKYIVLQWLEYNILCIMYCVQYIVLYIFSVFIICQICYV